MDSQTPFLFLPFVWIDQKIQKLIDRLMHACMRTFKPCLGHVRTQFLIGSILFEFMHQLTHRVTDKNWLKLAFEIFITFFVLTVIRHAILVADHIAPASGIPNFNAFVVRFINHMFPQEHRAVVHFIYQFGFIRIGLAYNWIPIVLTPFVFTMNLREYYTDYVIMDISSVLTIVLYYSFWTPYQLPPKKEVRVQKLTPVVLTSSAF